MSSSLLRRFVLWSFLCLPLPVLAGPLPDAIFANGFEPRCSGGANDPPDCVAVPFNQALPQPQRRIAIEADWTRVDVYLLLDHTTSMSAELAAVRNNAANQLMQLRCPPDGTGSATPCSESLWSGAGTFALSDSGVTSFRHILDVQTAPDFSALPTVSATGASAMEITRLALHAALTGVGGSSCGVAGFAPRTDCSASPAGAGGTGHACFRADATPLVVLFSDEQTSANFTCPDFETVVRPAYVARGARLAAITGAGSAAAVTSEYQGFAQATRAVDVTNGNQPLVLAGADGNAATALFNLVRTFINGAPMDVNVQLLDDPGDAVDAAIFVDHIETLQEGTPECASSLDAIDTGGHPSPDAYRNVRGGTPICFSVVLAPNTTVPAGIAAQEFPALLRIVNDANMTIEEIPLTFVVPRS